MEGTRFNGPKLGIPSWPVVAIAEEAAWLDACHDLDMEFETEQQPYCRGAGFRTTVDQLKLSLSDELTKEYQQRFDKGYSDFVRLREDLCLRIFDAPIRAVSGTRVKGDGWLKILFRISGDHSFVHQNQEQVDIPSGLCFINYQSRGTTTAEWDYPGRGCGVSIYCRPGFLTRVLGEAVEKLPAEIRQFACGEPPESIFQSVAMSADVARVVSEIVNVQYLGRLRQVFVEAKTLELLAALAHSTEQERLRPPPPVLLKAYDVDQLHRARDIIKNQYAAPPSIAQLSREVGLNRKKLGYGFKHLFGETIYDYCRHVRFEIASELLQQGEMTVSQVADAVGYEFTSNFSTAFKRHFGLAPTMVRDQSKQSVPAANKRVVPG